MIVPRKDPQNRAIFAEIAALPSAVRAVEAARERYTTAYGSDYEIQPDDYVFVHTRMGPWSLKAVCTNFREINEQLPAKFGRITAHKMRHSYASAQVNAGAPLEQVAKNLGHSDTKMLERVYFKASPEYLHRGLIDFG